MFFDLSKIKPTPPREYYHIKHLPKTFYGKMVFFNQTDNSNIETPRKLPINQKIRFSGVLIEIINKFSSMTEEHNALMEFFNNSIFTINLQGDPPLDLKPSVDHLVINGNRFYDKYIDRYSDEYLGKFCPQGFNIYPGQEFSLSMIIGVHRLKRDLRLKAVLSPKVEHRIKEPHKCKCKLNILMAMGCQCGGVWDLGLWDYGDVGMWDYYEWGD